MGKRKPPHPLGHRERQLMDAVYQLGEASVGDVLKLLPDPPSYSSVRKMLSLLEEKGLLRHRRERTRYLYRPTQTRESASRSALSHLMRTFFRGSAANTIAAVFDVTSGELKEKELKRLEQLIDQAKKEGR